MKTKEQNEVYHKAMRHLDDAKKMLAEKGEDEEGYYQNKKHVRTACGIASRGLFLATDFYLKMKGQPIVKKKGVPLNMEMYKENLTRVDRRVYDYYHTAYNIVCLGGYYEGLTGAAVLKTGFDDAMKIIKKIAPRGKSKIGESTIHRAKRSVSL